MRRTSATSRGDRQAGFTLIELLVVLAILGLATGWVAVRAGAFFGGGLGTAVSDARRALVDCRGQAQVMGVPILCKVDAAAMKVGSITLKGSPSAMALIGGVEGDSVLFYPSGEASAARLTVERGTVRQSLDVSAVTGRVRVLDDHAG